MRKIKMILSLVLVVALSFSMMTFGAFAEEIVYENGVEIDTELTSPWSYSVSASGSSGNRKGLQSGKSCVELFRIPVPALADNQTVSNFKFRFTTQNTQGYGNVGNGSIHVLKFAGENWTPESMTLNDANVSPIVNNTAAYCAYDSVVSVESYSGDSSKRFNTVDITSYAKEAIDNEQEYIYLGVYILNSTNIHGTGFWASEVGLYTPHYYFTPCERPIPDPVIVKNTADDATAFHITSSANPSSFAMTMPSIKYANNNYALFRLPLPKVEKGVELTGYTFKTVIGNVKNVSALKFAGEKWIMYPADGENGLRFGDDASSAIISEWYTNRNKSIYNAVDEITYEDYGNGFVWGIFDVTSYAKECIAANQTYMYIALISDSTQSCYGFRVGNSSSSQYSYSLAAKGSAPIAFSDVKIVNASEDVADFESVAHLSDVAKGSAYKAVCEFTVNSLKNETARIIIAQYNSDNELKNLIFGDAVTLSDSTDTRLLVSENLTIDAESDYVKAFVWRASDIQPLCVSAKSLVK